MMLFLALLACGDADGPEYKDRNRQVEQDTGEALLESECEVTWDAWANGFFTTYCKSCHSETSQNRYDAPDHVNLDTVADIRDWSQRIRIRVLDDQTMPVGGGVPEEELVRLDEWMVCLEASP